jgi:hypothetical protein
MQTLQSLRLLLHPRRSRRFLSSDLLRGFQQDPINPPSLWSRDPSHRYPFRVSAWARPYRIPRGRQAESCLSHRTRDADKRSGQRNGFQAGPHIPGVREENREEGEEAAGGAAVEDLMQRQEMRVCHEAGVRA